MRLQLGSFLITIAIAGCGRYTPGIISANPLHNTLIRMEQPASPAGGSGQATTQLCTGVDVTAAPHFTTSRQLYVARTHGSLAVLQRNGSTGAQVTSSLFLHGGRHSEVREDTHDFSIHGGGIQFDANIHHISGDIRLGFGMQLMLAAEFGSYQNLWIYDFETWFTPQAGFYLSADARLSPAVQLTLQAGGNAPGGARLSGSLTLDRAMIWASGGYLYRHYRVFTGGISYRIL